MLSLEEVQNMEEGLVKFVRIPGEYRFCNIDKNHKDTLNHCEKALSAGLLSLCGDGTFCFQDSWSMTLQVGVDKDDGDRLELLLGRKCVEKPY